MDPKVSEYHVVYKEWAIHRATGRIRHIPCKRDCTMFNAFKKNNKISIPIKKSKHNPMSYIGSIPSNFHGRREALLESTGPHIHKCQGTDRFDDIEEIEIPSMVVEIALCYMKV